MRNVIELAVISKLFTVASWIKCVINQNSIKKGRAAVDDI